MEDWFRCKDVIWQTETLLKSSSHSHENPVNNMGTSTVLCPPPTPPALPSDGAVDLFGSPNTSVHINHRWIDQRCDFEDSNHFVGSSWLLFSLELSCGLIRSVTRGILDWFAVVICLWCGILNRFLFWQLTFFPFFFLFLKQPDKFILKCLPLVEH